jgi:hypothetical protein
MAIKPNTKAQSTTKTGKPASAAKKENGSDKPTRQAFRAAAAAPGTDAPKKEKGKAAAASAAAEDDRPKRALGLRGAAPWAARHAAKHAAEARKRAAEPPPPGSARATIRTPSGVEEIKAQISELHNDLERIRSMRKNVAKTFFDIGIILRDIQARKLYAAKGFQSFESFVEREVDLGKTVAMRLVKLVGIFQRDAALEMGMERAIEALSQIESPEPVKPASESRLPVSKSVPNIVSKPPIVGR